MPTRPEFPWRPLGLALLLLGVTVWSLVTAPRTRLVGSARVYAGTVLPAPVEQGSASWDMDLRLDPAVRPPGPAWSLHEGRRPEDGYHLRWLPDRGILQVHRALPHPALLGSARLQRSPATISFRRRGGELSVIADGRTVLRCLDPMPGPPALLGVREQFWGCQCTTGGDLRESLLTVQTAPLAVPRWGSDGDPGTAPEEILRRRGDHALLRVRAALAAVTANLPAAPERLGAANAALGVARNDLATLWGHPPQVPDLLGVTEAERSRGTSVEDRVRLSQWLALARIQWWLGQERVPRKRILATEDPFAHLTLAREALDDLMDLGQRATNPEYPGMLLGLIPRLTTLACAVPDRAEDPRQVAERRRRWLDLLATAAEATTTIAEADLGDDDLRLLTLVRQACVALSRPRSVRSAQALPVDAPDWVKVRWRLLAGDAPQRDDLPPLPAGSSGLAPAITLLLGNPDLARAQASADCRQDLAARQRALAKGQEGRQEAHLLEDRAARLGDDPALSQRDRAIGLTLVALAIGPSRPALLIAARERLAPHTVLLTRRQHLSKDPSLAMATAEEPVLAEQDPLAWAILKVLLRRHPELVPTDDDLQARILTTLRPPDEYANLLSGKSEATAGIWLVRLPPAEALAAALAAQEAQVTPSSLGALPDWSLLDEVPNLGLPLHLLKPREDQAPGELDTP